MRTCEGVGRTRGGAREVGEARAVWGLGRWGRAHRSRAALCFSEALWVRMLFLMTGNTWWQLRQNRTPPDLQNDSPGNSRNRVSTDMLGCGDLRMEPRFFELGGVCRRARVRANWFMVTWVPGVVAVGVCGARGHAAVGCECTGQVGRGVRTRDAGRGAPASQRLRRRPRPTRGSSGRWVRRCSGHRQPGA